MSEKYTTQTASLKATTADVRIINAKTIDAKKIKLNGTNIEDLLSSGGSNVIIEDGREVKTKYDIWEHAAVENEDGSITVKNLYIPDASGWMNEFGNELNLNSKTTTSRGIIDNKLYIVSPDKNEVDDFFGAQVSPPIDESDMNDPVCSIDTSKIEIGDYLLYNGNRNNIGGLDDMYSTVTIKSNFDSLKSGVCMFSEKSYAERSSLIFISNLPNLIDGSNMFDSMIIEEFSSSAEKIAPISFDNLVNGSGMFLYCQFPNYELPDFPKLVNGNEMFWETYGLKKTIKSNFDSLKYATTMFCVSYIENFYSDLPKLVDGSWMFSLNNIKQFRGSIPSLENGYEMFNQCILDPESVLCIVSTIPDRTGLTNNANDGQGYIDIGIDCANNDEAKNAFVQEIDYDSWEELLQGFSDKNWNVRFQFNPRSSSYSLRGGNSSSPVYVKVEEAQEGLSPRELRRYRYTSADGSKFYNLHWYHDSNDSHGGYTQFESLQEAIEHFDLKEKENQ